MCVVGLGGRVGGEGRCVLMYEVGTEEMVERDGKDGWGVDDVETEG